MREAWVWVRVCVQIWVWVCRGYGMSIGMGMVISDWARFSRGVTIEVRAVLSLGLATWTLSQGNSQEKGNTRKKAGQGVSLESTAPPWVVDIFADSSEPQELWGLGADLLVPECCKNYREFPSPDLLLEAYLCLPTSATAWPFINFSMKAELLCEKVGSVKLPFSAKGTALSAWVTNNVPLPDFLIKFFHWRQGSLLVISVGEWLCCFSLELHRNNFRQKVNFFFFFNIDT